MAWLGKVSLGNFPDLAGAVNKLSESVKNIEKNFDSALGLEDRPDTGEASGIWPSSSDRKALFDPVMAFMGHRGDDSIADATGKVESSEHLPLAKEDVAPNEESPITSAQVNSHAEKANEDSDRQPKDGDSEAIDITSNVVGGLNEEKVEAETPQVEASDSGFGNMEEHDFTLAAQHREGEEVGTTTTTDLPSSISKPASSDGVEITDNAIHNVHDDLHAESDSRKNPEKEEMEAEKLVDGSSPDGATGLVNREVVPEAIECSSAEFGVLTNETAVENSGHISDENSSHIPDQQSSQIPDEHSAGILDEHSADVPDEHSADVPESVNARRDLDKLSGLNAHEDHSSEREEMVPLEKGSEMDGKGQHSSTTVNVLDSLDPVSEVEKVKKEMKLMEAALQGAARQAQAKADEIAKLMNENEHLKLTVDDLKRKSSEAEVDALREEYHQRVSSLERKVYALTRERDTLRREQSKKSDAAALLKEKDEIISQVMAEGEELSKKQATQEATIRKLRAQVRELDEDKQRFISKLQVEESKVESIKRDKAATEKLLQETIEKNQAELSAQKEFYSNALNAAKEAEALAEARVNSEAKVELESRLREAKEREAMLVQTLEELRQTLSRTEQQAVFREDMLRRDIDDLQRRYQASELRYNELVAQVPESTRPLLRQIEAMQETTARREEAWLGVERSLNSRLQEAEAKAAAAEERERSMNERLSQSLSRITVLETQITCMRTEQTQLSRSLEKERQRAAENRQEYLAAVEEAATQEGRAKQLEDEIKELRSKFKLELQEEMAHRELVEKELEREKCARAEQEKLLFRQTSVVADQGSRTKLPGPIAENGSIPIRKLSSAGSLSSIEESQFLQASLDSSDIFSERRISGEITMSPYFLKSMTPSAFEAALRQKDGELASYVSRLASLESIRDSLAEELVKMTAECEKLQAEAAFLPGIRAELEALRRRHSSALELMGERDEELEELRADIIDLKEMYREQVDLLVNKIQMMTSSAGPA